jgi:hypothetical protein
MPHLRDLPTGSETLVIPEILLEPGASSAPPLRDGQRPCSHEGDVARGPPWREHSISRHLGFPYIVQINR